MATFPTLKTGASAQYPLARTTRYSTQAVQFLDGSQQTFKLYPAALGRWSIQLDELDEAELNAVISFVEAEGGELFTYVDPTTGASVANCRIAGEAFGASMAREMAAKASIVIEEVA